MTQHGSVVRPPPFVQALHDTVFQRAVVQAAAIMDRPEFYGCFQQAMDFVLAGAMTQREDGTATVKSGVHIYTLAPDCPCQ
jgi:hypothetical protein